jgi:hypothetical protein
MAIQQILQNIFLNPLGLLGILGLLPLIVFYLTRPEPERKVMPSMEFFQQDERRSRLQNAFRKLQNNIILLLNILSIIVLSIGVAGLYLESQGAESSVIIYDRSVSMHDEHAEAVSTVLSEASTSNTVIVAGEDVEVYEEVNRQRAADIVRDKDPIYRQSNMASALQQAELYEGNIILLSNLDQGDSIRESYQELGSERGLRQMDYSTENRWGIVDVSENSVEVRNYQERQQNLELDINSEEREISLGPGETKQVEAEFEGGRNTVELPVDDFRLDNTAYVVNPEDESVEVEYHGPRNQYISTAIESMENVESSVDGDIIILNEENQQVYGSDKPKILMQGSASHWQASESAEEEISFDQPYSITINSGVYDIQPTNDSLTDPKRAVFREGETYYYNIEDSEFRSNFMYPLVWKDMIYQLEPSKTFANVNQEVSESEFDQPGFHDGKAVNYLGNPRTGFESLGLESSSSSIKENQVSMIALILLIILSSETLIMLQRGVYR